MRKRRPSFVRAVKPRLRFNVLSLDSEPMNEGELQEKICRWLDDSLPVEWRYFATLNGVALGGSPASRARRINSLKAKGLKLGVADLIFLRRDGLRWCACELKFKKRPTTEGQDEWIEWAGGNIATANSREKVAEFLRKHGIEVMP